jgi:hypothetical protein
MAKAPAAEASKAWTLKTLAVSETGDKTWTIQTYDTQDEANAAKALTISSPMVAMNWLCRGYLVADTIPAWQLAGLAYGPTHTSLDHDK